MNRFVPPITAVLLAGTGLALPLSTAAQTKALPRAAAAMDAPAPTIKLPYERFTLPNGLTTLVYTDRTVPNVYVGLWYKTGSKDEPKGRSGFAHLFEHLMFQQTANRKGEFLAIMDRAGASGMNGSTTSDYTNYYEIVPTNALDMALWMESDRMGYLGGGITQAVLDEQRAVVKNEKRMRESPAAEETQRRFMAAFYPPDHPYAHTTIGSMEDLDAASLDDVKQWFEDHYGAGNAVLVLAGDIDVATAREKVTRYFGAIRRGKAFSSPDQWVPSLGGVRRDVLYFDDAAPRLVRYWPVSNDDPRGNTLLRLGMLTMTSVLNAPLADYLVDKAKVAVSVGSDFEFNKLHSTASISMVLQPGVTPEQAGAALDAALAAYFRDGPSPTALGSIIKGTDTAVLRAMDSNASLGEFLIEGEVLNDDPGFFLKQRDWALKATPGEVAAVAARWLGPQRPYYEQVTPATPAGPTAQTADVDRTRIPVAGPLKTAVTMPPVTQMTLGNGMKLVVVERHKLPIVDVAMQFDTGTLADASYTPGAAAAAFGLIREGTAVRSGAQVVERVRALDVPLTTTLGDRTASFRWSAGTARLDDGFALAAEVLRQPAYPADKVAGAASGTEARLKAQQDPAGRADRLLTHAIFGDADPRGRLARPEDYRGLTRDAVVRFHDREIGPSNATLLMVGDVTPAQAKALAERHFGTWRGNTPAASKALPPTRPQQPRIILLDSPGASQSSITVGNVVPPFDGGGDAAEQLANAVFANGSNGRLNMNLRETKGWTYNFGGGIGDAASGDRLFTAGGSIETAHTAEAMAEIRREMADLLSTRPIAEDELDAVQNTVIRSMPDRLAGSPNILATMESALAFKLPFNSIETAGDRVSAVTLDDARAAAKRLYRPDQLTWVVVGDLKAIEPGIRALGLAPVEVWDANGRKLR